MRHTNTLHHTHAASRDAAVRWQGALATEVRKHYQPSEAADAFQVGLTKRLALGARQEQPKRQIWAPVPLGTHL